MFEMQKRLEIAKIRVNYMNVLIVNKETLGFIGYLTISTREIVLFAIRV